MGIDLRLVRAASLTGGSSPRPGEEETQERDEKTSTDEQQACASDRLRAFIAHTICHVRHGIQQSIQRQTDLNHFRACVVGGVHLRFPPDGFPFGQGDGRPFLRQELHSRACHGKVLVEAGGGPLRYLPAHCCRSLRHGILRLNTGPLRAEFLHAGWARIP